MKTSTLVRLAAVGVAVTAIAACTPRRPVEGAAGDTTPPVTGPQYPTAPTGPVDGGNLGAATPGSEKDIVVNVGDRRAESVRSYLVPRGVSAARIDTISYGKERPIAAGSNEEAWARNRNAHTAIVSGATR